MLPTPLSRFWSFEECEENGGKEGFLCRCGLGSEPVARGDVMACRRPIAVSAGCKDGDEVVGECSTYLCFFLWEGGPKPSWSDSDKEKTHTQTMLVSTKNWSFKCLEFESPLKNDEVLFLQTCQYETVLLKCD